MNDEVDRAHDSAMRAARIIWELHEGNDFAETYLRIYSEVAQEYVQPEEPPHE